MKDASSPKKAWLNSGMRIMTCIVKYDRTCQRSIKIIRVEKTVALHKSAQQKKKFPRIFFKRKILMSSIYSCKKCKF